MNSEVLRECAENAGLKASETVIYKGGHVGYPDADPADSSAIKDEIETMLGYRPCVIQEPTVEINQTDQT
jgi:hypothetical protein